MMNEKKFKYLPFYIVTLYLLFLISCSPNNNNSVHINKNDTSLHISDTVDLKETAYYNESDDIDQLVNLLNEKIKLNDSIPSSTPIEKEDIESIGDYGMRLHPILKYIRMHEGVDISAKYGEPIYSTNNGIVKDVSFQPKGLGLYVEIASNSDYTIYYGHCSKIYVHKGQKIDKGDLIAAVGSSGLSTGNHLHYEIRKNGRPVDPKEYMSNKFLVSSYLRILNNFNKNYSKKIDSF